MPGQWWRSIRLTLHLHYECGRSWVTCNVKVGGGTQRWACRGDVVGARCFRGPYASRLAPVAVRVAPRAAIASSTRTETALARLRACRAGQTTDRHGGCPWMACATSHMRYWRTVTRASWSWRITQLGGARRAWRHRALRLHRCTTVQGLCYPLMRACREVGNAPRRCPPRGGCRRAPSYHAIVRTRCQRDPSARV